MPVRKGTVAALKILFARTFPKRSHAFVLRSVPCCHIAPAPTLLRSQITNTLHLGCNRRR